MNFKEVFSKKFYGETAKANGFEPCAYLCHVLTLLPTYHQHEEKDIEDLLPWNVKLAENLFF